MEACSSVNTSLVQTTAQKFCWITKVSQLIAEYHEKISGKSNNIKIIDLYHTVAMLSLRRIRSFVFAWQASATREFSARLAVRKQSFLFLRDSTWPPSDKVLWHKMLITR